MTTVRRLVVMISGEGTNLQALIDACGSGKLNAKIVGVVSNKVSAGGLKRAQDANISTITAPFNKSMDRKVYDTQLASIVGEDETRPYSISWMDAYSYKRVHRFVS